MSEKPEFILDREFDAPRDLVWRVWTDPDLIPRWYGPTAQTIVHKFDLKPGGLWLGEMKWGDNSKFSKIIFQEVVPQEKLSWHDSSTDAEWKITASPMMPDWPRVMLITVTFEDVGTRTSVRLTMMPVDATEAENACFAAAMSGMGKGWGSGFAEIDELLAQLRSAT